MIRFSLLIALAAVLCGCASLNYPLPKCDGQSRRPLNRSMWEWEGVRDLKPPRFDTKLTTSTTPYAEQTAESAAFACFDIDASRRSCAE
ncbi:hypothetical protein WH297_15715 [Ochrobactrum vermis]|uniref:Type IV secretion system protein VirB7 n=1 Tax=Ochrobactrum vermis TaxID=1827297 RepID=A0ABU8PGI3_9HYPH|nr:hypothetical protein [Ochrobactrum vermis]PQZ25563.1 hypothetical protein CQZ93_15995 [Ochrobactrum vermis]